MLKQDTIDIVILKDGTVKFTTPKISGANHQSADAFLKTATDLLGGETKTTRRIGVDASLVEALHEHTHDGHTHSH